MPIKIKDGLPAIAKLEKENIFVMTNTKAGHQDIRPLKIAILNLMPEKIKTEIQLLRRLSNTPIQIEVDLLRTKTHKSKNTTERHLQTFYTDYSQIKDKKYDGLIITGAPVENLAFEDVDYWDELKEIMQWSRNNVTSTLHICWAAQAGLYFHNGINKHPIPSKKFGVFSHTLNDRKCPLVRGFDDAFWAPHSRHTTVLREDFSKSDDIDIISESDDAGIYMAMSKDGKQIYVTGHSEYDILTLKDEFDRDVAKGFEIEVPKNYFPNDDPMEKPIVKWNSHSTLLFSNWINYYVYQMTPYEIDDIV